MFCCPDVKKKKKNRIIYLAQPGLLGRTVLLPKIKLLFWRSGSQKTFLNLLQSNPSQMCSMKRDAKQTSFPLCNYKRHALTHTFSLRCCTVVTHPHIKLSVEVMHSNKGEEFFSLSQTHTRTHSLKEQSVSFCKLLPSVMKTCAKIDIGLTHQKKMVSARCRYSC